MIAYGTLLIALVLTVLVEDAIRDTRELMELYARDKAGTL